MLELAIFSNIIIVGTIHPRTPFPENILVLLREHKFKVEIIACSSLYHVLMRYGKSTYLLQDGNTVDLKSRVFNNLAPARFSPDGQLLAFLVHDRGTLYILDILTMKIRSNLPLYSTRGSKLEFVDEEHLLCKGYKNCLCLINVKTCEVLTCVSLGLDEKPWGVFACHKTIGIIVRRGKFKLIKLNGYHSIVMMGMNY
jgi:hypothetical protein